MSIQQLFFSGAAANQVTATGGTITYDGDWQIHTFNSSGTFTITSQSVNAPVRYLVVGGGASGDGVVGKAAFPDSCGTDGGPGGGGGTVNLQTTETTNQFTTNTGYTVTIGAGGVGSVYNSNGNTSSLVGKANASGGTTQQGGLGGGLACDTDLASNGGSGTAGTTVSTNGISGTYAGFGGGGGGGSGEFQGAGPDGGAGGSGGGGNGGGGGGSCNNGGPGESGTANTGGGGGGAGGWAGCPNNQSYPNMPGGSGGSGVVIISFKFRNN